MRKCILLDILFTILFTGLALSPAALAGKMGKDRSLKGAKFFVMAERKTPVAGREVVLVRFEKDGLITLVKNSNFLERAGSREATLGMFRAQNSPYWKSWKHLLSQARNRVLKRQRVARGLAHAANILPDDRARRHELEGTGGVWLRGVELDSRDPYSALALTFLREVVAHPDFKPVDAVSIGQGKRAYETDVRPLTVTSRKASQLECLPYGERARACRAREFGVAYLAK